MTHRGWEELAGKTGGTEDSSATALVSGTPEEDPRHNEALLSGRCEPYGPQIAAEYTEARFRARAFHPEFDFRRVRSKNNGIVAATCVSRACR